MRSRHSSLRASRPASRPAAYTGALIGALRRAVCGVAGATLVLAACEAPAITRPAAAYNHTTLTGGLLYRWRSGTTVHVWTVTESGAPMDLALAVRQAITQWNGVRQFAEFTLVPAATIGEADIVVYVRASAAPVLAGSCPFDARSAAGYTYFCPGSGVPQRAQPLSLAAGGTSAARVVIRVDRGRVDAQRAYNAIVAHEFGHALGIGAHSDHADDLMFGLPTAERPTARDAATLRFLLGQPAGLTL